MRKYSVWILLGVALVFTLFMAGCAERPTTPVTAASGKLSNTSTDMVYFTSMGRLADPVSGNGGTIPTEYLVVLKGSPIAKPGQRVQVNHVAMSLARAAGVTPKYTYSTVINGFAGRLTAAQYEHLSADPNVLRIEPNRTVCADAQNVPWGITKVKAPVSHLRGVRGVGVKVGIIDTGMDYHHPELARHYAGGYNVIYGSADPLDDHGHGTHVAGIVAGLDNTQGVLGVAPAAELYAIKVLDYTGHGSTADVVGGIDWAAANGLQVVNMSLGARYGSWVEEMACDNATAWGTLICASTGNDNDYVGYPGAYASVIGVAATDQNNARAWFSNYGPQVDCAAPGVDVFSTYYYGGYYTLSGTSMACPHVTGVCALLYSTGRYTTPAAVRSRLLSTCTALSGPSTYFGHGLVNADAATMGVTTNHSPTARVNGPFTSTVWTTLSFSPSGSLDSDGQIDSYYWDFGDGSSSTSANPTHAYARAGVYTITLIVTDDNGSPGIATTTATISGGGGSDVVKIVSADFNILTFQLTVRATSTLQPGAELWCMGYPMTWKKAWNSVGYYEMMVSYWPGPPMVTVTSSRGGSACRTTSTPAI